MKEAVQEADLPELAELGGGHGLEGFTGDTHVIPDRDGQVGIGAVAVLHSEGSLLLLCLHQPIKEPWVSEAAWQEGIQQARRESKQTFTF